MTSPADADPSTPLSAAPTFRVLVIDDDRELRGLIRRIMLRHGHVVDTARNGEDGIAAATSMRPDVVVLDLRLPDIDGFEVMRRLRERNDDVPVLMLTAHGELDHRIEGFATGIDDFLEKPFHVEELLARLHALVRRRLPTATAPGHSNDSIRFADVIVDRAGRRAWRGTRLLDLTRREFDVLDVLIERHGHVVSRDLLDELVWQGSLDPNSNAVDVYVGYVRRKLEADGEERILHTVRGSGYVIREAPL